jgi:hypothetical protein
MARSDWGNQNENRAYPFLRGSTGVGGGPLTLAALPDSAVVDAGFVAGALSRFDPAAHSVFLNRLTRAGGVFSFEFGSDAPELYGVPLVFTRRADDPDYLTSFADSGTPGSASSWSGSTPESACAEPLWSGFLVTGRMADLALFLPVNGVVERGGGASVEPALVQSLAGARVTSLTLANDDRTRVTPPGGCPAEVFPYPTGVLHVNARCLTGNVALKAGYNATVGQSPGTLTLGAVVGAGEGQPCREVPAFSGETPPAGSLLLEGGPRCNEVLRSINGFGGSDFVISVGTGVSVTPVPDVHSVVVDVGLGGLAVQYRISQVSESC